MTRTASLRALCIVLCLSAFMPCLAHADPNAVCPRSPAGSIVPAVEELRSTNGTLETTLSFLSAVDSTGLTRYCYVTETGALSPTLRVHPGDTLIIHLVNTLDATVASGAMMDMSMPAGSSGTACSGATMTDASTNLHFHGLNLPPTCHQDEVVHTLVQPGQTFDYKLQIPANEPAGLYWYHPHAHGLSAHQVNGGATGAIIVEGIANTFPALAGLTERTFVLRDQQISAADQNANDSDQPSWDISLNYVPILYPSYLPAVIEPTANAQEFWRVVNSAADTIFNLQILSHGVAQAVQIYSIDGVPVPGGPIAASTLFLPPGSRVEFVISTPAAGDSAQWVTTRWDAGPAGDSAPPRPIANVVPVQAGSSGVPAARLALVPRTRATVTRKPARFSGLSEATPSAQRTLFFSEEGQENPQQTPNFFITVDGQDPAVFSPLAAPNIITRSGTVEDWTIQNRSDEDHIFHIHQIHFQVLEVNGVAVSDPAIRDTTRVDHYSGTGTYPSIKVRLDFRDPILIGTFVYHCHILDHEDHGMMGQIEVLPPAVATSASLSAVPAAPSLNTSVTFTSVVTPATAGGPPPTGYVAFQVDGIGRPQRLSDGTATYTTNFSSVGPHSIALSYGGDNTYSASAAQPLSIIVPAPQFQLSAAQTSLTITGTSASAVVTAAAIGGFASLISLSCELPAAMTHAACSINPATIMGSGQSTLVITTTPTQAVSADKESKKYGALLAAGALPLLLCFARGGRRKSLPALLLGVIISEVLFACVAVGCGGPGVGSSPSAAQSGTPAGTYVVVVRGVSGTGSSALQDTLSFQVTVNQGQ